MTDSGEYFDVVFIRGALPPDTPRTVRISPKAVARLRARQSFAVRITPPPAETASPLAEAGSHAALSARPLSPTRPGG